MKKIFYFILFTLPFFSFSQSKSDLEKELKIMNEKNEKLEKKIKELTDNVDKLTVKNENKKADKTEAFQKLIKENNEVFFTKLFEENYKKDDTFFKKTGLANEKVRGAVFTGNPACCHASIPPSRLKILASSQP